jgi:formylglycine-generating enzyme required for sulfatase activity
MMGGPVDKAEVEALRKKMAGEEVSALPDPAKLAPAGAGKAFKNSLGMDFVPAGDKLLAGSSEVRMQDFEAWLKASGRTWEAKPSFLLGGTHPAAGLSWQDAHDFCEWLTKRDIAFKLIPDKAAYRLPTDVEWSLLAGLKEETGADPAARSGVVKDHFPWSATGAFPPPPMSTNLDALKVPDYSDSYSYTAPVSTEAPNPMGISGLGGNVAEWCRDSWPGDDSARVVRGGSWLSSDKDKLLTSARRRAPAAAASPDIGFRVVLELPAP